MMNTCTWKGCEKEQFMDDDNCFEHIGRADRLPFGSLFVAVWLFMAVASLTVSAVVVWAVVTLVMWVTR